MNLQQPFLRHGTTALGSIDSVTIKNLLVLDGNSKCNIPLAGCLDSRAEYKNSINKISSITFTDIQIINDVFNSDNQRISTNE